jgi:hypothetical protein
MVNLQLTLVREEFYTDFERVGVLEEKLLRSLIFHISCQSYGVES